MLIRADYSILSIIPAVILLHLFVAPYTKVEESFNIQAIHDILKHGIPFSNVAEELAKNYDHVTFSGSVPRSFAGALILSALTKPFAGLCGDGQQLQILGAIEHFRQSAHPVKLRLL